MLWTNAKSNQNYSLDNVNSKMKNREGISRLKVNGQMCEDLAELAEIKNRSFQPVFTKERTFVWQSEMSEEMGLGEV